MTPNTDQINYCISRTVELYYHESSSNYSTEEKQKKVGGQHVNIHEQTNLSLCEFGMIICIRVTVSKWLRLSAVKRNKQ